jgi:membrane-associated protease RseP (regulator of RpoE activity)
MNSTLRTNAWARLLLILTLLLPLMILFLLPGGPLVRGGPWFWLMLLFSFFVIRGLLAPSPRAAEMTAEPEIQMLPPEKQLEVVREVMNVRMATEEAGVRTFHGRLLEPALQAYDKLQRASPEGAVPHLQEDERHGAVIVVRPKSVEESALERSGFPWMNVLLFAATVLTTTFAGAAHQGVDLLRSPEQFAVGLPYALGLLMILGVHELGHYFAARWHGIHVTMPYFIPVPFALGTFGAFIQMKSPAENRRALFDVAVAGPLAGLVVAIPLLLIGLQSSTVVRGQVVGGRLTTPEEPASQEDTEPPVVVGGTSVGSSLLLVLLAKLALPDALRYGCLLQFSPLAFAGWLGLFITGLNLMPIGQLDGGHTVRALFGHRVGSAISNVALWSLLFLGLFVWRGLLTWAIIAFFMAGQPTPPLNDLTPLTVGRRWLGYLTLGLLLLIMVPLPPELWPAAGLHCPYVR